MNDHTTGDAGPEPDAEARRTERRFGDRSFGPTPLPFQFQVPLGGGAPGIALPLGGYRSPFALTVPLGGTSMPAAAPPTGVAAPATAPAPAARPPAAPGVAPATIAIVDVPPGDAPLD